MNNLTVLTASSPRGKPITTKTYTKGWDGAGPISPEFPYLNLVTEHEVRDIWELSDVLRSLEDDPHSCVIRGIAKGDTPAPCRRLGINFNDVPHHWVCFDFDSIPGQLTPEEVVWRCLPAEFHDVSFHYQYSGSHGFKPGTRIHVSFMVDKPIDCIGWLLWLASHGVDDAGKPLLQVDPALYRVVQPHITANPILRGVSDPVAVRSGIVQGDSDVVPFTLGDHSVEAVRRMASGKRDIPPPPPTEERKARQTGVIGEFNLAFPVGDVLQWFGYQKVGSRYLHPYSQSLIPDTVINSGTHAYVFSTENPLYEQGVDRSTGEILNRNHDAFDCFRILGFEGREAIAVAAAATRLEVGDA